MEALHRWCLQQLELPDDAPSALEPVSGDASFRRYFRLRTDLDSYVVMDAPPAHEDCRPFIDVAARLRAAGVHAPEILAQDLSRGWLLLEDLGDELYRETLDAAGADPARAEPLLADVFAVLQRLATAVDFSGLPPYDDARLQQELDLFPDWYLARHLDDPFSESERALWDKLCRQLLASAAEQPQVFVHRDFHSCNLLRLERDNPGVIDFQDAVIGPVSYDLVSLLLDRYISWPRPQLEAWMEQFRQQVAAEVEPLTWRRWCDWMGLQRNLKIVGIFARLYYRDDKHGYLELIPRFADYVLDVIARYEEFAPCRDMLERRLCAR